MGASAWSLKLFSWSVEGKYFLLRSCNQPQATLQLAVHTGLGPREIPI